MEKIEWKNRKKYKNRKMNEGKEIEWKTRRKIEKIEKRMKE